TATAAMAPLAPARFSTTTGWPSAAPRGSEIISAARSVEPPGAAPTSMVIGLPGNPLCANAQGAATAAARAVKTKSRRRDIIALRSMGPWGVGARHRAFANGVEVGGRAVQIEPASGLHDLARDVVADQA